MVYTYKAGAHIKVDANIAGQMCEQLERTVGLTAKNLLDANRSEDAPLHGEFEWNDSIAAEAYREDQARYIIRSLCVKPEDKKTEPIRAFFTIGSPQYESLPVIFSVQEKTDALFEIALRELKAIKAKYNTLEKLRPVFDAIEQIAM